MKATITIENKKHTECVFSKEEIIELLKDALIEKCGMDPKLKQRINSFIDYHYEHDQYNGDSWREFKGYKLTLVEELV